MSVPVVAISTPALSADAYIEDVAGRWVAQPSSSSAPFAEQCAVDGIDIDFDETEQSMTWTPIGRQASRPVLSDIGLNTMIATFSTGDGDMQGEYILVLNSRDRLLMMKQSSVFNEREYDTPKESGRQIRGSFSAVAQAYMRCPDPIV